MQSRCPSIRTDAVKFSVNQNGCSHVVRQSELMQSRCPSIRTDAVTFHRVDRFKPVQRHSTLLLGTSNNPSFYFYWNSSRFSGRSSCTKLYLVFLCFFVFLWFGRRAKDMEDCTNLCSESNTHDLFLFFCLKRVFVMTIWCSAHLVTS